MLFYGLEIIFADTTLTDPNPQKWLVILWPCVPYLKVFSVFISYLTVICRFMWDHKALQFRIKANADRRKRIKEMRNALAEHEMKNT